MGALDGWSSISLDDFKKWQCPLSLFLKFVMSILISPFNVTILLLVIYFLISIGFMSPFNFKK